MYLEVFTYEVMYYIDNKFIFKNLWFTNIIKSSNLLSYNLTSNDFLSLYLFCMNSAGGTNIWSGYEYK